MQITMDLFDSNLSSKYASYSTAQDSVSLPRHRWYFVKEAFSPFLVEKAIQDTECATGEYIVDPFCGSGTVPLTASLNGYRSVAFEVNPFLAFVARAKLLQTDQHRIERGFQSVMVGVNQGKKSELEDFSTFSEAGGAAKWLFNAEVLQAFEGGWDASELLPSIERDLLRLALLKAAMETCNAYRDGKCLRYRKDWQEKRFGRVEFIAALEKHVEVIMYDLNESTTSGDLGLVVSGDSRKVLSSALTEKFKLCVTSPPYLNSFDYSDVYRPELFLGKFVRSNKELMKVRLAALRSHMQASWEMPTEDSFGSHYSEAIARIRQQEDELWNKRIPNMIQAYFEDIQTVLRNLRHNAKPDASVWLVVSTSAYAGVEVPVDNIIADIAAQVQWHPRRVEVIRQLRSSGQHWNRWSQGNSEKPRLRESIVILDASPRTTNF